jgi:hypothetical protein
LQLPWKDQLRGLLDIKQLWLKLDHISYGNYNMTTLFDVIPINLLSELITECKSILCLPKSLIHLIFKYMHNI